ncbi:hypothetical protein ANN_13947 [Periplaneta americana]|uniref:Uncharacterized protein n=1 Tax=Periplaneta americana TaxID=6978 RepID=A0ABQ8SVI3_PERAM|nr:hypothetical protein ANN_13947 [Periplaneta americana]
MGKQMVRCCCRQFSAGHQTAHGEKRSGRPTIITDDLVEQRTICLLMTLGLWSNAPCCPGPLHICGVLEEMGPSSYRPAPVSPADAWMPHSRDMRPSAALESRHVRARRIQGEREDKNNKEKTRKTTRRQGEEGEIRRMRGVKEHKETTSRKRGKKENNGKQREEKKNKGGIRRTRRLQGQEGEEKEEEEEEEEEEGESNDNNTTTRRTQNKENSRRRRERRLHFRVTINSQVTPYFLPSEEKDLVLRQKFRSNGSVLESERDDDDDDDDDDDGGGGGGEKSIFCGPLEKELRNRLVKCFVWSVELYGTETWTLRQNEEKRIEAFEMWIWRRMERVKWTDRVKNEAVLERVGEERMMLKLIRKRKRN